MSCDMPQVSGWPGLGGGLLRGMMVGSMSFAEELPGLTFMLLTLSALGVRPSWADEQSKIQMLTLPGCVYSNILAAILVWS
jgi:predicted lipid-binding transport protein (Tim44 family)